MATTPRRSVYADRLHAFGAIVSDDRNVFTRRGAWRQHFASRIGPAFDGTVIIEIGCSDADLLSRVATKHPTTAFIGIDWKYRAVFEAASRVTGLGLSNVALLRGRAQDIARIFDVGEIDEIWVFHPDPCDRDVEVKNRLISDRFLTDAYGVLRDGQPSICVKTDHVGYYQWILSLFEAPQPSRDRFDIAFTSTDFWNDRAAVAHTAPRRFAGEMTPYENRFRRKRHPIYYCELCKK